MKGSGGYGEGFGWLAQGVPVPPEESVSCFFSGGRGVDWRWWLFLLSLRMCATKTSPVDAYRYPSAMGGLIPNVISQSQSTNQNERDCFLHQIVKLLVAQQYRSVVQTDSGASHATCNQSPFFEHVSLIKKTNNSRNGSLNLLILGSANRKISCNRPSLVLVFSG